MKDRGIEVQVRKQYLDVLRAFAAIGVIFIHVSANNWYGFIGSNDWISFTVYEGLFKISVPIFFMISGCLFLNSEKEKSIKEIFGHSIFRLVVFLLFWSVVYKIVEFPQNELSISKNIMNMFGEILKGNTQVHLWFVYAIIGLYVLVPLMRPCVKNSSQNTLLYIIIICIIGGSIYEFANCFEMLGVLSYNLNKIKAGISFGYIGYFLLGAYIDRYNIKPKGRKIIYALGVAGIIAAIALVLYDCISTQTLNERFLSYNMPGIFLASTAFFLAAKNIEFKDGLFLKIMTAVSEKSLGIYGVHFLFITILWKLGFTTFLFPGILSVPVIALIVLGASFVSSMLLRKLPYVGKYLA